MTARSSRQAWRAYRKAEAAVHVVEALPLWTRVEVELPRPTAAQVAESERRAERRFLAEPAPLTGFDSL